MITFTKRETIIYSRELSRSEAESIVRDHHADPESVAPLAGLTDGQLSEVARSGTADRPRWWLYIRRGETEECQSHSHRLRDVKSCAQCVEANAPASD